MTETRSASSRTVTGSEEARLMLFRLGDGEFAVPVGVVEEVAACGPIRPLSDAPDFLAGSASLREEEVPVIDLGRHLAVPAAPAHRSRLLLVREAGRRVGLIVDEVLGVEPYDPATVSPVPDEYLGAARPYLRGVVRLGARLVLVLEPEGLLTSAEREALAALPSPTSG